MFCVFCHSGGFMKKLICACAIIIAGGLYLWWGNNSLSVTNHTVRNDAVPESFDGYRIVQLSDIHNKDFRGRLSEKVKTLSPDIIVITGDLIDSRRTNLSVSEKLINELKTVAPIYYVTGNHESRIPEYSELREILEKNGVAVLDGKNIPIERNGDAIILTGIDDATFFGSGTLNEREIIFTQRLKELAKDKGRNFGILLSHRPELIDIYAECGFDLAFTGHAHGGPEHFSQYMAMGADLVFSGHAHGGQVRLPFVGGILTPNQGFFPEYDAGEFKKDGLTMIVSRGLGNSVFPFRIFNRPEIIVCELMR